jgi:uncharacterized protein (DUF1778 family)
MTTSAQNPLNKSAQISLTIPLALRPLLVQAAAIQNVSVSRFVYEHGFEAARQVVEKHELKQTDTNHP